MSTTLKHSLLFGAALFLMSCKPSGPQDIKIQAVGNFKVGSQNIDFVVTSPLTDETLELEGNMNMGGMKPAFGLARRIGDGLYRANNFSFDMAGDWILTVKALEQGKTITSQIAILVK
jgi:hypothetical protein